MAEIQAANAAVENPAAVNPAENPASSQAEVKPVTGQQAGTEQDAEAKAEPDVSTTQAFAHRLKEETEKVRKSIADALGVDNLDSYIEQTKAQGVKVDLQQDERFSLERDRDAAFKSLVDKGLPEEIALDYANRTMNTKAAQMLESRRSAAVNEAKGKAEREKLQDSLTAMQKELEELKAGKAVQASNAQAAQAATPRIERTGCGQGLLHFR